MISEPLIREAAIHAFDTLSQKVAKASAIRGTALAKLIGSWKDLDREEKERVVSIVIATTVAAVAAVSAARSRSRGKRVAKKARKAARRAGKAARKVT